MLIKKLFLSFSVLILFASVISCASETSTEPKEGVINIAIETALGTKVGIKETLQLAVNIKTKGGVSEDVVWSSGDESIATVDTNGLVTGVGLGTVTITVTSTADNSKTASVSIEVVLPPVVLTGTISYTSGQSFFYGDTNTLAVDTTSLTAGTGTITYKDTTSAAIAGVSVDASTGKITVDSTVAIGAYTVDVSVSSSDGGSAMTSVTFDVIARYVVRISTLGGGFVAVNPDKTVSELLVYEIRGLNGRNEVQESSYELGQDTKLDDGVWPLSNAFDDDNSTTYTAIESTISPTTRFSLLIRYPTAVDQINIAFNSVSSVIQEGFQIEYSTDGGQTFLNEYGPQNLTITGGLGREDTFSF